MFLDDLKMLRRRSQLDESNRRMNLAIVSKFIDGVENDEFRTKLATHYTPISTNAPTPETRTGESRNKGLGNAPADPEVDNEKTSRQRIKARISTSTKLPGIDRVTPPLVTLLVENGQH